MNMRRAWPVLAVLLVACGGPSVGPPTHAVRVTVAWRGATPAEVERDLLEPLEAATARLADVVAMRGTAEPGVATLELRVRSAARVDGLAAETRAAVAAVAPQLPADADPPVVARVRRGGAVVVATISLVDASAADLAPRAAALRDHLQTLPGVDAVDVCGVQAQAVRVTLDPAALVARGLDAAAVSAALRARAWDLPRGSRSAADAHPPDIDALARSPIAPGVVVADVGQVRLTAPAGCVAVTAAGGAVIVEVALHDRAGTAGVLAALRAAGAVPFARALTVGVVVVDGARRTALDRLAAGLVEAGAAAVRVDVPRNTVEILLDVDLASSAGEATLATVEAVAAQRAAAGVRWSGPAVRAFEAVVDASAQAPEAAAVAAARIAVEAGTHPLITPRVVTSRLVTIDRARAAALGLSVAAVAHTLRVASDGEPVAVEQLGDARREVRLGWPALDDASLLELPLRAASGEFRQLGDVVTISEQRGFDRILREDRRRVEIYWLRVPRTTTVGAVRQILRRALPGAWVRPAAPDLRW